MRAASEITRQDMEEKSVVRRSLNIGFPSEGLDAAAGDPHVSQELLDNRHCPDVLGPDGMLRPAHGIEDITRLIGTRSVRTPDKPPVACLSGYLLFWIPSRGYTASSVSSEVGTRIEDPAVWRPLVSAFGIHLVGPGSLVIGIILQSGKNTGIVAGKLECRIHQEAGVRVMLYISS